MSGGGLKLDAPDVMKGAGVSATVACVLCGDVPQRHVGEKNGFHLWRCEGCGMIAARGDAGAFDAAAYYGADYFQGSDEKFGYLDYRQDAWVERWNCRRRWKEITEWFRKSCRTSHKSSRMSQVAGRTTCDVRRATKSVLDVGCATGTFLAMAPDGWERCGLDVSEYAVTAARRTVGGEVVCGELGAAPWSERSFDLVTLWDVLDHLSDPVSALRQCRRLLREDGLLIAHVTNIGSRFARVCRNGWHLLIPPTHLHYLTPSSARRVLEATGYRLLRIRRPGKWVPLRLVAFRVAYLMPSRMSRWFKAWLERSPVGSIPIYFNFWDVMTLYAVKSADADLTARDQGQVTGDKGRGVGHPSPIAHHPSRALLQWVLGLAIVVNLAATLYGISWGLLARWNVDQEVTEAVKMAAEQRWLTYDIYHPPFYKIVLLTALAPYAGYLALRGVSFNELAAAASVSWHRLTQVAPDVASGLFLVARGLSVCFGVVMIWLVYRIGRRLMSPIGAVAAAAALAVTMGFVGDNHLERSSPLVNLLGVVALWSAVAALDERSDAAGRARRLMVGWFVAGLACAVKYNGVVLVLPVLMATCWSGDVVRGLLRGTGCWLVGLLIGWPMLPLSIGQLQESARVYSMFLYDAGVEVGIWPVRLLNYLIQLVTVFGVPLAVCVAGGVVAAVQSVRRRELGWRGWVVLLVWAAVYLSLAASYRHRYAHTKFIMLIVPVLALAAGWGIERWLASGRWPRWLRVGALALILGYSAAYTVAGSAHYAGGDTRYEASRWIQEALPPDAAIEHLQQPSWLFTESLLDERRILFLGELTRDAYRTAMKSDPSASLFQDMQPRIAAHVERLARGEGAARYLAVAFPGAEYEVGSSEDPWVRFIGRLRAGELPYRPVATFEPRNVKVASQRVRGLTYPRYLWWHPVPNDYVSPAIVVYERVS